MKRQYRIVIIIIPVIVLFVGIGLWRHHYLKSLKAEPGTVYKSTPLQPKKLSNDNTHISTPRKNEDSTVVDIDPSITTQDIDKNIAHEEIDNPSTEIKIGDEVQTSDLPPEAVTALKEYEKAQAAYVASIKQLQDAMDIEPIDFNSIKLANESIEISKNQHIDALSKLAKYLDEAFFELLKIQEQEKQTDKIIAERTAGSEHLLSPELRNLFRIFETMSPEERENVIRENFKTEGQ